MLVVKQLMVVVFPINPDATLLIMCARLANPMLIVHLQQPIAMLMVLAKIAELKVLPVEIVVLVELLLMVLLVLVPPTATVIPSLVSVWISVSKTLIVLRPAPLGVKLNVVAV